MYYYLSGLFNIHESKLNTISIYKDHRSFECFVLYTQNPKKQNWFKSHLLSLISKILNIYKV